MSGEEDFDVKQFTRTVNEHQSSINDLKKQVLLKHDYASFAECFEKSSGKQKQIETSIEKKVKYLLENNKPIKDLLKTIFNDFDKNKNYTQLFSFLKWIGSLILAILLLIIGALINSKF